MIEPTAEQETPEVHEDAEELRAYLLSAHAAMERELDEELDADE